MKIFSHVHVRAREVLVASNEIMSRLARPRPSAGSAHFQPRWCKPTIDGTPCKEKEFSIQFPQQKKYNFHPSFTLLDKDFSLSRLVLIGVLKFRGIKIQNIKVWPYYDSLIECQRFKVRSKGARSVYTGPLTSQGSLLWILLSPGCIRKQDLCYRAIAWELLFTGSVGKIQII